MKVVICGAGQVGYGIAQRLAAERNDVSIIDTSARLIQSISDTLDVRGFVGHGAHPDVLAQAGAEQADMLIAATLHDEVNMVACQVANANFNVPTKIARIRSQSYLSPQWRNLFAREHMAIDVVISPEIEVGEMIMRRLALPGSTETVHFADDKIVVAGIICEEDCPVVDTPLRQLTGLFPDLRAVVVGVNRSGNLFIPRSADSLVTGDLAYVVADVEAMPRTLSIFGHDEVPAQRVIIAGGGNIGLYVARELERRNARSKSKLVEFSRERAIAIADELERSVVLNGSALDRDILEEADVASADMMLALTNDDQVNILSCVMAKTLGAKSNLALLNKVDYLPFVSGLGLDAYISPRQITVSRILQHVRRGRVRAVHSVMDGAAEVVEGEVLSTSPLVGKPLRELGGLDGMRIGAVYRNGKVILPRGGLQIAEKDRVIVFAASDRLRQVEQLFRVSLEFF